jgi:hypothetical protein
MDLFETQQGKMMKEQGQDYHDATSRSTTLLMDDPLSSARVLVGGRALQTSQYWAQIGGDLDGEAATDWYGYSVSLSSDGTVVAVGGRLNEAGGVNMGHVRVFKYNAASNVWTQLGSDIDGEANHNNSGHSVSLSSDGSVVAIGAPGNTSKAGHVRVYVYNIPTSTWIQRGADMDGAAANDSSGSSVSLSSDGNVVAIGAPQRDRGLPGYVRVYEYSGSAWIRRGTVDLIGEANSDEFGYSVSLSDNGNILAVGAPRNDGSSASDNRGHVRVFSYASGAWSMMGSEIDGEAAGDSFGTSVSLSANGYVLAVGACTSNGALGHAAVYAYNLASNAWAKRGGNINGHIAGEWTGISVSLSSDGNTVAVGARGEPEYVYTFVSSAWTQVGCAIDEVKYGDEAGYSVSLSSDGSVLAIGAPYADGPGTLLGERGQVRIFKLVAGTCPTSPPTSLPTTALPTSQPTFQPTTASPTFQPSAQPTTALPTSLPTTALPTVQPTAQPTTALPTSQPTANPTTALPTSLPTTALPTVQPTAQPTTALPTFVTLPFLGGCPPQVTEFDSVHHEPGDRVSYGALVFECKSWPLSLFCSQAAFNPTTSNLDSKTEQWKRAWEVVGHCSGGIAHTTVGCPDLWTSGNIDKYKENDQVSVIKSTTPFVQAIYKCKSLPYSWHCGHHSPLDYNGGHLGWEYVGVCTGTIGPTMSPTLAAGTVVIAGCPAGYNSSANSNYKAGDQVSRSKVVYQCREFPYSGYCNQKAFAPGEQYDYMAWTLLGPCDGTTLAPTSAPTVYSGSSPCTYAKIVTTTPTPTPVVTPVVTWSVGTLYEAGDQVRIGAKKFQCKPWPFYFWCRVSAYAPTLSDTGLWTEAWTLAGTCPA